MIQISNKIYCEEFLTKLDIKTKLLTNPYYEYPYLIIKNFLPKNICNEITQATKINDDIVEAKIKTTENLVKKSTINKKIRKTKIHKLNDIHTELYRESFLKNQQKIEDFFSLVITESTKIQVLEYTKGSFYKQHSDDSNVILKDGKIIGFKPVAPQRKLSSVLFTTDGKDSSLENSFLGGELRFNYLYDEENKNVSFKPESGDMIVFLSNPYFTHEVLEVKEGYRLSLVQWHNALV